MLNRAYFALQNDHLLTRPGHMGTQIHGKGLFRSEIRNQKINVIVDRTRLVLLAVGNTDLSIVDLEFGE